MLNDEFTPEVEQEDNKIDIDLSEDGNEETPSPTEEKVDWEAKAKALQAIIERHKRKQSEAKEVKPQSVPQTINNQFPEELKLIAKGLSDEDIEQAKVIAKGKGISLQDAIKDPLFEAHQKVEREKARREEARLGASKGSGQSEKETFRPGMTDEEHKELWKKTFLK